MTRDKILIVGGYGEVGSRIAAQLEAERPGRVIVAGRHPEKARGLPARPIDLGEPDSIEGALDGIDTVVACVRQREPHLLRAAVRRGLAYTSIAPPRITWADTEPLRAEAERTGARIILGAGLEPGITSVLVRAAADRLGAVETVESALLLSLGDTYGPDSMGFILDEVAESYTITVDGRPRAMHAFEDAKRVAFPSPIGRQRAYTMPFTDQFYYPTTTGARTAIARIALDPPWLADTIAALLRVGLRRALRRGRGALHGGLDALRRRYRDRDRYALVLEVRGNGRGLRWTLVGRQQAAATAAGAAAITAALASREVADAGVWLAEQVVTPGPFLARLAAQGLVPVATELPGAMDAAANPPAP